MMRHWLMKSEPSVFSVDDLARAPGGVTSWDGVRNYQARNLMRDGMRVGDRVLFYHSSAEETGVAGIAEIVREAYPDPTQFDPRSDHHDPGATPDAPRWLQVDVRLVRKLPRVVLLEDLRAHPALARMEVLRRGNRLSVQPVTPEEFAVVEALAEQRAGGTGDDPAASRDGESNSATKKAATQGRLAPTSSSPTSSSPTSSSPTSSAQTSSKPKKSATPKTTAAPRKPPAPTAAATPGSARPDAKKPRPPKAPRRAGNPGRNRGK